jgi:hypothetical protein
MARRWLVLDGVVRAALYPQAQRENVPRQASGIVRNHFSNVERFSISQSAMATARSLSSYPETRSHAIAR